MKFSIIVPVYNVEEYIAPCVDSLLKQTHRDVEIILIDDGSVDGSGAICDQYAGRHPERIKVRHSINQGPHMARMQGIDMVSGDAVLFVDADDMLRADALVQIASCFEKTNCDMILFNASRDEDFRTAFYEFPFENGQCFGDRDKEILYKEIILNNNMNSLCLKAVKREVLSAISEECRRFSGRHAEDLWLTLPLLTAAQRIAFLNQNLYYYRTRSGSIVHSYNPARHRSIRTVHEMMERYIDTWGMEEYHPLHYAREVRGWIECLKMVLVNGKNQELPVLRELAEADYFIKAYDKMERNVLSRSDALLAEWLYRKQYGWILMAGKILRGIKAMKRHLKGH